MTLAKWNYPKSHKSFDSWFSKFNSQFNKSWKSFGFTKSQKKTWNNSWKNWHSAYTKWHKAHAAERAAYKALSHHQSSAWKRFRTWWPKFYRNTHNSGQFRWFGVPTWGSPSKATRSKPASRPTTRPWVKADFTGRGRVHVWVGTSRSSWGKSPTWAKGAYIQFRIGTSGKWRTLDRSSTSWPFVHAVGKNYSGRTIYYRAAWTHTSGKRGPWSAAYSFSAKSKAA